MKTKLIIIVLALGIAGLAVFFCLYLTKNKTKTPNLPSSQIINTELQKRGEELYRKKMYAPHIALYKNLLDKMPESVDLKKKLAFAYFGAGEYERAKPLLEEVAKTPLKDDEVVRELTFILSLSKDQ